MPAELSRFIVRVLRVPATMWARTRLWMRAGMADVPLDSSRVMTPAELLGALNETEQRHAPPTLYVTGRLDVIDGGPRVAIVGSRRPTREGLEAAAGLARDLCAQRVVIVSGLAAGIDTAAHRASITAGGRTIGVLGTPLEKAYPAANAELQRHMAREQLLVSQFAPRTRTRPEHFALRNRTMALIADASIIVEAGESSGTQHHGWEMIRLGRPVYFHPGLASATGLKWPREMLRYGARVLNSLGDLLDELPPVGRISSVHAPF